MATSRVPNRGLRLRFLKLHLSLLCDGLPSPSRVLWLWEIKTFDSAMQTADYRCDGLGSPYPSPATHYLATTPAAMSMPWSYLAHAVEIAIRAKDDAAVADRHRSVEVAIIAVELVAS